MPIPTFWRFIDAVMLMNASAATGALTLPRLGTDRKQHGCWGPQRDQASELLLLVCLFKLV